MGAIWLNGSTHGFPNVVDVLRAAGVNVVEFEGWRNRSRSSGGFNNLMGILDHHTASQTTPANDLNYMVYGSPDAPVSNGLLDRTGTFTIIAAGASNHGGRGGGSADGGGETWVTSRGPVPPDASNSNCFGIECANNGVGEPYPVAQQDAYIKMNRALVDAYGMVPSMDIRSHAEWTPPRKIDPRGPSRWQPANSSSPWNMNAFRDEVAGTLPAPTPGGNLVFHIIHVDGSNAAFVGMLDGKGIGHTLSWVTNGNQLQAWRNLKVPERNLAMSDLANLWLVGPLPVGDHLHGWSGGEFAGVAS